MANENEQISGGLPSGDNATIQTKGEKIPGFGTLGAVGVQATPEYLQNLQNMIDQRTGGFKTFLDSMKDAVAITSHDPGSAMAARDQEKRLEQQSIFEMRNQMAALKAAQEQANARRQTFLGQIGLGGEQAPQQGGQAPQQGGQAPQQGGQAPQQGGTFPPGFDPSQRAYILSIARDPNRTQEAEALYQKELARISEARAKGRYDAAGLKQETYLINGTPYTLTGSEYAEARDTGMLPDGTPFNARTAKVVQGAQVPYNSDTAISHVLRREGSAYKENDGNTGNPVKYGINAGANPGIDVKNLTEDQARNIYKNKYWDAIGADKLSPAAAHVAFDAAVNQGVDYAKDLIAKTGGDPQKMLDQRTLDYVSLAQTNPKKAPFLNGWLNRVKDVKDTLPGGAPATTNTGTAAGAVVPQPAQPKFGTKEDYNLYNKEREGIIAGKSAGATEYGKKTGDTLANLQNDQDPAKVSIANADKVREIGLDPKRNHVMGYFQGGNRAATALTSVIPDSIVDSKVVNNVFNPQERTDYQALQSISTQMGMQFTKDNVANARLGIGMEKLGLQGKGVSPHNTPEMNVMFANINKDISQFKLDKFNAYNQWCARNGLDNEAPTNYNKFVTQSPEYKQLADTYREKLVNSYKGVIAPVHTDDEARDWLAKNPNHPKAAAVRKSLEGK